MRGRRGRRRWRRRRGRWGWHEAARAPANADVVVHEVAVRVFRGVDTRGAGRVPTEFAADEEAVVGEPGHAGRERRGALVHGHPRADGAVFRDDHAIERGLITLPGAAKQLAVNQPVRVRRDADARAPTQEVRHVRDDRVLGILAEVIADFAGQHGVAAHPLADHAADIRGHAALAATFVVIAGGQVCVAAQRQAERVARLLAEQSELGADPEVAHLVAAPAFVGERHARIDTATFRVVVEQLLVVAVDPLDKVPRSEQVHAFRDAVRDVRREIGDVHLALGRVERVALD